MSQSDLALQEGFGLWSNNDPERPLPKLPAVQSEWETINVQGKLTKVKDSITTQEDQARLLASSEPHSGSLLNAIPSPQLGTRLSDECFRASIALRLGCITC